MTTMHRHALTEGLAGAQPTLGRSHPKVHEVLIGGAERLTCLTARASQNRLVQCVSGGNTSQFIYGADGLRRTSIVNGNPVHTVLDSSMMVRELVPSGQTLIPKATYLIGPRGPEYRYDHQTQAIRWYLYDGLGSVLGEVDPAGNVTASRKYDVYGLVRAGDNGTSRHRFVGSLGHTSEDETGLIYMRARWMDPALGRFISEDPARDGANWFDYCRGNPVNAVDPDGRVWVFWSLWTQEAFILWKIALSYSNTFRRIGTAICTGFVNFASISGDVNDKAIATIFTSAHGVAASRPVEPRSLAQEALGLGAGYSATLMVWFFFLYHDFSAPAAPGGIAKFL